VDDDLDVLEMAHCFFRNVGLEVHCAASGDEAIGKVLDSGFAVIITDFQMPGMNGLELAGKIREITPHTPIIMITGKPCQELIDLAKEAGIKTVLNKPLHPEVMLNLVNETILTTSS
jgi:CheY-like chemotaxis protein